MKLLKQLLIKINDINERQWLLFAIVSTSVGLWFPFIVNFFGIYLKLLIKDQNGVVHWTPLGIIITIITILWSFLSLLSQKYADYRKHINTSLEDYSEENALFQCLFNSICSIEDYVSRNNTKYLKKESDNISFFWDYFRDLQEKTETIATQMSSLLSTLLSSKDFNLHERDIVVNIYYKFPTLNDTWYRANNGRREFGFSVDELASKETTFHECINNKNMVFYYSKQKAKNENKYIYDEMDEMMQGKDGSIACYYTNVRIDKTVFVEIVMAISTYGKRFAKYNTVEENEEHVNNIKHNINEFFFRLFDPYVKNALFSAYLIERNKKQVINKTKGEKIKFLGTLKKTFQSTSESEKF